MNNWICKYCQQANAGGMGFCSNCGQPNAGNRPNTPEEPPPTMFMPPTSPRAADAAAPNRFPPVSSAPKKGFPWLWLALGGVSFFGLLLIGGGAILAYSLGMFGGTGKKERIDISIKTPGSTPSNNSSNTSANSSNTAGVDEKESVRRATIAVLDACLTDDLTKAGAYVKRDEMNVADFCREAKYNLQKDGYKIWQTQVSKVGETTVGLAEISSKNRSKGEAYLYFDKKANEFLLYKIEEIK